MRRPRWIGVLVFALLVAAAFAWLGKWQLTRAVEARQTGPQVTETTHPLTDMLTPGKAIAIDRVGQLATVTADFVPGDEVLLTNRDNHGTRGYWVVGHATVTLTDGSQAQLAVARGFTASRSQAISVRDRLAAAGAEHVELTGRLLPTEPPEQPEDSQDGTPPTMNDMSVATLVNLWHGLGDTPQIYEAYLVGRDHVPSGLDAIYSPKPIPQTSLDWLNVFYAVEWVVFAGFALYLWYRLTKDAWERETEDRAAALAAAETSGAADRTDSEKVD